MNYNGLIEETNAGKNHRFEKSYQTSLRPKTCLSPGEILLKCLNLNPEKAKYRMTEGANNP